MYIAQGLIFEADLVVLLIQRFHRREAFGVPSICLYFLLIPCRHFYNRI